MPTLESAPLQSQLINNSLSQLHTPVFGKATSLFWRRRPIATRRVCIQSRSRLRAVFTRVLPPTFPGPRQRGRGSTSVDAAVGFALYQHHFGLGKPLYQNGTERHSNHNTTYGNTHCASLGQMELVDDFGKTVFETIKITLVCDECLLGDHPEKCRHKLASMPRWLSSAKVEVVRKLLAGEPAFVYQCLFSILNVLSCARAQRTQLCCARHSLPRLGP